jgi:hypothetical protein
MNAKRLTRTILALSLVLLMPVTNLKAQQVEEVGVYFQNSKSAEKEAIKNLIVGVNQTVYLENGESKVVGGSSPSVVKTDVKSTSKLKEVLNANPFIEMIEIRLSSKGEERNIQLDSDLLDNTGVKCVLVRSEFELPVPAIQSMLAPLNKKNLILLYQIIIPE